MNDKELISVIIPVYNCEKTVEAAIRSILHQTYKNLEVIVVDDHSTDFTKEVVTKIMEQDSRVQLVEGVEDPYRFDKKLGRNVNAGYSARNTGVRYARGKFIAFQDADDVSLLNRLEIQYELLTKHGAVHVTTDWAQYNEKYRGKKLDIIGFMSDHTDRMLGPEELYRMASKTKGTVAKLSPYLNKIIPFHIKRKRLLNKLFFGSLESYPGIPGVTLMRREVFEKVHFRKLSERVWPSFMGRGADRDFNFQVAETFKNSYVFFIPLYLWRVKNQNPLYMHGIDQYIID